MKLSDRLERIASFVREGSVMADIGTDHGYIPIYLVEQGVCPRAYAMDVREGPLLRAREHIESAGLADRIEVRLSDGLAELAPGEADTVLIAGMGGELICRILDQGKEVLEQAERLVLSPHSEVPQVRRFLETAGFEILREDMVKEEGKYYTVLEAGHGSGRLERDLYYAYGKQLLKEKHPVLSEYLRKEHGTLTLLLASLEEKNTEGAMRRREEIREEIRRNEEAQHEMQ